MLVDLLYYLNYFFILGDTELQLDACLDDVSIDFEFIENNLDLNEKVCTLKIF